jgi:hypothetical protein
MADEANTVVVAENGRGKFGNDVTPRTAPNAKPRRAESTGCRAGSRSPARSTTRCARG